MSMQNAGRRIFGFWPRYTKGKPMELTAALIDAARLNTYITESSFMFSPGKKRGFQANYYKPVCTDSGSCSDNLCDGATPQELTQELFSLTQCTASQKIAVGKDEVRLVDNMWTFSDHMIERLFALLPTVRKKMQDQQAALLAANVGVMTNGYTSRRIPMINQGTGAATPYGLWEIDREYRDSGYGVYNEPYIVGGAADVYQWQKAVDIGGENALGQRIDRLGRSRVYYDSVINTAFGGGLNGHIIAFDPEMLKFVAFNKNAGIWATEKRSIEDMDSMFRLGYPEEIRGIFIDPLTGLSWDLNVMYDKCWGAEGEWRAQIKLEWDILFMPPSICNAAGVNGITHWTTCPPAEIPCPTDVSPISPLGTRTFSAATGSLSFPITNVSTLTVAGAYTEPNEPAANLAALLPIINEGAPAGYTFTINGSNLQYTGYSAITVIVNGTTLTFS